MPEDSRPIKSDLNLRASGDDDSLQGQAFARTPLYQDEEGYLLLEGHAFSGQVWEDDQSYYQGSLGLVQRSALDADTAIGVNGFVDFGDYGTFLGQASLGFEFESVDEAARSFRFGGNGYLPFEDYSEGRDLTRAPRLGGDLYLGLGRQWRYHRLEGFLTGFYYNPTSDAESLWGGRAELEWRYEGLDFLPEGSHLYANLGARYDTFESDFSPVFGFGLSFSLNEDATSHDRVAEVRRNIAFGNAFVPIDYKPAAATGGTPPTPVSGDYGCGPGGASLTFAFGASVSLNEFGHPNFPGRAPLGQSLLEIVGIDRINTECTNLVAGGAEGIPPVYDVITQCVQELSALDEDPNNPGLGLPLLSVNVSWFSNAGTCDTSINIFGG